MSYLPLAKSDERINLPLRNKIKSFLKRLIKILIDICEFAQIRHTRGEARGQSRRGA